MAMMRFLLALLMLVGSVDGLKEQPFVTKDEFAALQQLLKVKYNKIIFSPTNFL